MERLEGHLINEQFVNNSFIGFMPNEDIMNPDLQKKLRRISKVRDGVYEIKFKIDRYKFDRAIRNEFSAANSLNALLHQIQTETNTEVLLHFKSKQNSKLRNPLVNVVGSLEGIETAKERILSVFENIKMRVVLKMDVSYKDHSHIIGRGGFSIQSVMDETGSHIHFPDSNRISDVKKSNVVLVCGSPVGVEQARCKIRSLLPLVVHFKIPYEYVKRTPTDTNYPAKNLRAIQQTYGVHISCRSSDNIDEAHGVIFGCPGTMKYMCVSVRGANNELHKLKDCLNVLITRMTDCNPLSLKIEFILTIEITEFYHQLVMGSNYCNIRSIMQQTGSTIIFPEVDTNQRSLDFDNLNEIPVNKSTVIIKGNSFESVHQAWKELIGYLPLVLTLDVAHDHTIDTALQNQLKKQYKVAIFLKHKEKFNTVVIRGIEKNSRALFEVRKQLLKLDDAEIPICCDNHSLGNKLLLNNLDENGNLALFKNENSTNLLSLINRNSNGSNLLNGVTNSPTNILNAKMMQTIDSNNNLATNVEKNGLTSNYNVLSNANNSSIEQVQNMFHPMLFQAVLQEQYNTLQRQQQLNQRNKHQQTSPTTNATLQNSQYNNNDLFNHAQAQALNVLSNPNLTEEIGKMLRQQQGLIDNSMRTHSVSDIPSLINQASSIYNNNNNDNNLHQAAIKKEHLTSSCSSPALNAMVMHNNSSLLNNNNFSMNNSNLNSTGNNTSSTSSNANSLTANNSFNSNGLNSPPTNSGSSFNSSLINTSQSPTSVQQQNHVNWPDQRRQLINYDECKYLALKNIYEKPDSNEVRIPSSTWSGLGFSKSMSTDTLRNNKLNEWSPSFTNPKLTSNIGLGIDDLSNGSTNAAISKLNSAGTDSTDFDWSDMMNRNVQQLQSKQRSLIKQESEICSSSHPYSSSYLNSLIGTNGNQFANSLTPFTPSIGLPNNSFASLADGIPDVRFDVNNIDLDKVLVELGLCKFAETFQKKDINFLRFLALTEKDLEDMGIPYHSRRKLYSTIIQLRTFFPSNQVNNYLMANGSKKLDEESAKIGLIKQRLRTLSNSSLNDLDDSQKTAAKDDSLTKPSSLFDNATSPSMKSDTTESGSEKKQSSIDDNLNSQQSDFDDICTEFESIKFKNCKIDKDESAKSLNNESIKNNDSFEMIKGDSLEQDEKAKADEISELNADKAEISEDESSENKMVNQTDEQNLVKHTVQEVAQA